MIETALVVDTALIESIARLGPIPKPRELPILEWAVDTMNEWHCEEYVGGTYVEGEGCAF